MPVPGASGPVTKGSSVAYTPEENIDDTPAAVEMETSFLAYSMSVIVSRALPDVRDGLKPVQRRILYSMHDLGLRPDTSFVKSARVVGDVIGRFHPHGDSAAYEAMVRMAQDFSLRLPLVEGHGNFGTHSDPAAAARYTEARMSHAAAALTAGLGEDVVDMRPNYDGKLIEPSVMPAAFPNLLVNGVDGIAVGMATKLPPHNLAETIKACQHLLAHPDATVDDLIAHIPAPDFPTGGILLDAGGAHEAYRTGRGAFRIRARTEIVGREIVVTELPYQVGPERVIERIKELRDAGKLDEVANVVDLSDRLNGLRLVITAKRTAKGVPVNPAAVRAKLFKLTPLQESFNVHSLALVNNQPRTLTLLELVSHFVDHRMSVTTRRCLFRKNKAETRAHLLEGYLVALAGIDEVVAVIRSSRDTDSARNKLMKQFKLDETQATSILEMPLRRLTNLEVKKIRDELDELRKTIKELIGYLSSDAAMRTLVSNELEENCARFINPRRTTVAGPDEDNDVAAENVAVPDVPVRISLTATGRLGRHDQTPHKGARSKDDVLTAWVDCSVRDIVGVLTSQGRLLYLHPIDVPVCEGKNRGGPASEFIADLHPHEDVVALLPLGPTGQPTDGVLALGTQRGQVKRIAAKDLPRKASQDVIGLKDGDRVIGAHWASTAVDADTLDLVFVTSSAQLLRFPASTVRPQGKTGAGVAGIRLGEGDLVVAFSVLRGDDERSLFTCTDRGRVKRSASGDYPRKGRGTGGVRCMRFLRDDTEITSAFLGTDSEVTGVAESGSPTSAPEADGRRDAAGEPSSTVRWGLRRP